MFNLSTVPTPFLWAAAIIVAFPLTSVALGEVILRLRRRGHALAVPFANLRSVVLPALVVLVLMREVVGWDGRGTAVRLVETLLWLFIVHTALSFLNAILFAGAKEGSWQSKFPRLFIDLIRLLVVLMAAAVVLSTVWEQDLAKLVAALGVGTICVGLALQQPLGNLFSGIFLMIERPIAVGDWVKYDVHTGKVIETTWRAVHLRTRDQNLVVIPNGSLATGTFTNYSRPGRAARRTVTFGFAYADPPNKVKRVLREAAVRTPGVLASPAPKVQMLNEFADPNNVYEVRLMVADFEPSDDVVEEYRTLVWYAAERFGLHMTSATQVQMVGDQSPAPAPLSRHAIAAFPRFDLGREAAAGGRGRIGREAVRPGRAGRRRGSAVGRHPPDPGRDGPAERPRRRRRRRRDRPPRAGRVLRREEPGVGPGERRDRHCRRRPGGARARHRRPARRPRADAPAGPGDRAGHGEPTEGDHRPAFGAALRVTVAVRAARPPDRLSPVRVFPTEGDR